jgi:hypothetical protein
MPQWFGITTSQFSTAAAACGRLEDVQFVARISRQQWPLVFRVPGLATPLILRLGFLGRWLSVRMLRAWWERRILRCFVQPSFQLRDLCQQQPNDGLRLWRLTSDKFFRDLLERHNQDVAKIANCAKTSFLPRRVNGYRNTSPANVTRRQNGFQSSQ